jgi:polypeptide N-acetylgalactosaminyltransferase
LPKKVKLLRLEQRQGLVRARLKGAKNASGDVLMFLDAHCEVIKQWLVF